MLRPATFLLLVVAFSGSLVTGAAANSAPLKPVDLAGACGYARDSLLSSSKHPNIGKTYSLTIVSCTRVDAYRVRTRYYQEPFKPRPHLGYWTCGNSQITTKTSSGFRARLNNGSCWGLTKAEKNATDLRPLDQRSACATAVATLEAKNSALNKVRAYIDSCELINAHRAVIYTYGITRKSESSSTGMGCDNNFGITADATGYHYTPLGGFECLGGVKWDRSDA